MTKFIRWQGIVVFVTIIALLTAFIYLFADLIAKKAMERGLENYTGAEVNVASVEINYSPFIVKAKQIELTDAAQPTQNTVQIGELTAGADIWQYLLGRIHVEELIADKVEFATKRDSQGRVYRAPDSSITDALKAKAQQTLNEAEITLPDPEELLAGSNLRTVKAANALEQSYQEESAKLAELKTKLPTKETLDNYKAQVEGLTKNKVKSIEDVARIKKEFEVIKKQFEQDKAIVLETKEQLSTTKAIMSERIATLKAAPEQDWQEIESTYQLDKIDSGDFAHMLFGPKAREYHDNALMAYQYIKPLLAPSQEQQQEVVNAAKGRFIHFDEDNPQPDILIKKAHFSIVTPQGDFDIDLSQVTHQHWLINKPSTFSLESNNLMVDGLAKLAGEFSLTPDHQFKSLGNWQLDKVPLPKTTLADSEKLAIDLLSGLLAGQGQFNVTNNDLDSTNAFTLSQAKYQGDAQSSLAKSVLETINAMDTLNIGVNAKGLLDDPRLSITSPLNQILQKAVVTQVNSKLAGFKSNIQGGLNKKLSSGLSIGDNAQSDILDFESLLNATDGTLDNLLKNDVVKQQEDALKNKAKDKLKSKLGDLFGGL